MYKIIGILVLACTIALSNPISAQNYTPEEQEVIQTLSEMAMVVKDFKGAGDLEKLMSYYDKNFKVHRTEYSIDGTLRNVTRDYDQFREEISNFAASDEDVSYKIDGINYIKVIGHAAVLNYNTTFSVSQNKELLYAGTQNSTMQLVKRASGWKIIRSDVVDMVDEVNRYSCKYSVFKKGDNEVIAKVKYPAGSYFTEDYVDITFNKETGGKTILNTDKGDSFIWDGSAIMQQKGDAKPSTFAAASTKEGVIEKILLHYHGDVCSGVRNEL